MDCSYLLRTIVMFCAIILANFRENGASLTLLQSRMRINVLAIRKLRGGSDAEGISENNNDIEDHQDISSVKETEVMEVKKSFLDFVRLYFGALQQYLLLPFFVQRCSPFVGRL